MIHLIFAQADIGQLQANLIKSLVIVGIVVLVVGSFAVAAIVGVLQYRLEKRSKKEPQKREILPDPLRTERVPTRFNPALAKEQHDNLKDRVDDHDAELDKIWFAMRAEDEATRKELRDYVADTNLSLGRIEGALGTQPPKKP